MLDIEKLIEIKEALSLKYICDEAGLDYNKISKSIYSYKRNPENGHIFEEDGEKLQRGLKKAGFSPIETKSPLIKRPK